MFIFFLKCLPQNSQDKQCVRLGENSNRILIREITFTIIQLIDME